MERIKNYIEKNGFIYGVSSKYDFGKWNHSINYFESLESAEEWLNAEQYDFRQREIMTESAAKRLVGARGWKEYQESEFFKVPHQA